MQQGTTEHSLIFRPYTPDTDLPHLARLLAGIEAVDQDGEDTSENALRAQLAWPNYHPSEDCYSRSALLARPMR